MEIGSSISLASKIASIAQPNQVLVGEFIYNILNSSANNEDFLRDFLLVFNHNKGLDLDYVRRYMPNYHEKIEWLKMSGNFLSTDEINLIYTS